MSPSPEYTQKELVLPALPICVQESDLKNRTLFKNKDIVSISLDFDEIETAFRRCLKVVKRTTRDSAFQYTVICKDAFQLNRSFLLFIS